MHWVLPIFNESVFLTVYFIQEIQKIQTSNWTILIQTKILWIETVSSIGEFFKGT